MPRALAIETSGRVGSIALVSDEAIVAERQFPHGLRNAAMILPIIDQLCRDQAWRPTDIQQIFISIGPGSFTGLRIGVTLAKTMAMVTGARIVAVPTMQVLARQMPAEARNILIVLDAKRGQIFTARFARSADEVLQEVEPAHLDRLRDIFARSPWPIYLVGEGIDLHRAEFDASDDEIVVADSSLWTARARTVALLGLQMARRGEFTEPDHLVPIYIRLPEAEEKWMAMQQIRKT